MQTAIPVLSFIPRPGLADIGNLGLLVHLAADAVAHVLPDDSDPMPLSDGLDGGGNVADAGPGLDLADSRPHRLPPSPLMRRAASGDDFADAHREGGVSVKSLEDRPGVDRQDIARSQPVGRRDPVDDDVIDREAEMARVGDLVRGWLVSEERRGATALLCDLGGDLVQVQKGHPRFGRLADRLVDRGDTGARPRPSWRIPDRT